MKYAIITLDNSVLQAEMSSLVSITSPAKGYVEINFSKEPDLITGKIDCIYPVELGEIKLTLLLPYAPKITFTNTSRLKDLNNYGRI